MNLVVHENVRVAHQLGCAAAKQGKFLAYKDAFWDKSFGAYKRSGGKDPSTLAPEFILRWAGEAGLNADSLKADGEGPECQRRVAEDMAELRKFHVGGRIAKEQFSQMVKEKLEIAKKSGVPANEYYAKEIFEKGEKKWRAAKRGSKKAP